MEPYDAEFRGKVLAAINGVSRAGTVVALGLGGLVGGWLGSRATFVGGAVCALVVVAALAWLLRGVDPTAPIPEDVLAPALGPAWPAAGARTVRDGSPRAAYQSVRGRMIEVGVRDPR